MTKKTHTIITIALSAVLLMFMAYFLYDTHQRAGSVAKVEMTTFILPVQRHIGSQTSQ
jgi:hypothetical protein